MAEFFRKPGKPDPTHPMKGVPKPEPLDPNAVGVQGLWRLATTKNPDATPEIDRLKQRWHSPAAHQAKWYCPHCGTVGAPLTITKGSMSVEVLLWLFFLLPGLFYSIWRLASRYEGCPTCKQPGMIPADSPKARAMQTKGKA